MLCSAVRVLSFLPPTRQQCGLLVKRRAVQHCLADAFTVHVQLSMLKPEMLLVYSQIFVTFVLDAVPQGSFTNYVDRCFDFFDPSPLTG